MSSLEDLLGDARSSKTLQKLLALPHDPRVLRGDEVPEDLTYNFFSLMPNPLESGLRMLSEGASDTSDLLVGAPGDHSMLAVPKLPETSRSKGDERQGAALSLDLAIISSTKASSSKAKPQRRAGSTIARRKSLAASGARGIAFEHREPGRDIDDRGRRSHPEWRREHGYRLRPRAVRETPRSGLNLRRVEREELLELVHDEKRLPVPLPPPPHQPHRHVGVVEPHELLQSLGVR